MRPALPAAYEAKSVCVFGAAPNTPCGVREEANGSKRPNGTPGVRLEMVGTTQGDGTVTWDSGRIGGAGRDYYLPAAHGDLLSTQGYFSALADLLVSGSTIRLEQPPPSTRAIEQPLPVSYDASSPTADDPDAVLRGLMGGSARNRVPPRTKRRLEVVVKAMDLRFLSEPILVEHYENDPSDAAEALIDKELLDYDLSDRHSRGLYTGPRGSATVMLREPSDLERARLPERGSSSPAWAVMTARSARPT